MNKKIIQEAFKSNQLRQWVKQHGGLDRNNSQDSAGDITDEQVGYFEEFPSRQEANNRRRELVKADRLGKRSDYDMSYFFRIYTANDGSAVLVGLDRNTFKTGITWGGETSAKRAERIWRGKPLDRGVYSYTHKQNPYGRGIAKDFGVYDSNGFKGKMKDIKRSKKRNPEAHAEWRDNSLKRSHEYIKNEYPQMYDTMRRNGSFKINESQLRRVIRESINDLMEKSSLVQEIKEYLLTMVNDVRVGGSQVELYVSDMNKFAVDKVMKKYGNRVKVVHLPNYRQYRITVL